MVQAEAAKTGDEDFIEIYRLKIRNDPKIITPRMYQVLSSGRYEKTEAMLARKYLNSSDTVLEFGSGLGVVAAIAVKRANVKRVISVEANPDLHPIITDTLRNSVVLWNGPARQCKRTIRTRLADVEVSLKAGPATVERLCRGLDDEVVRWRLLPGAQCDRGTERIEQYAQPRHIRRLVNLAVAGTLTEKQRRHMHAAALGRGGPGRPRDRRQQVFENERGAVPLVQRG